jgi:hypothetical protein
MADQILTGFPEPVAGRTKWSFVDHTGPLSYVTGGETYPTQSAFGGPNNLGLSGVYFVVPTWSSDGAYYIVPKYAGKGGVRGTATLQWFVAATGQQVAAGTNLSGATVRLMVIGG